uniref:Ras-related protein Rab-33 n=1 Tax=Panagrellus redivivus TaxID=6233 RepID=A0A7E4W907_PANRE
MQPAPITISPMINTETSVPQRPSFPTSPTSAFQVVPQQPSAQTSNVGGSNDNNYAVNKPKFVQYPSSKPNPTPTPAYGPPPAAATTTEAGESNAGTEQPIQPIPKVPTVHVAQPNMKINYTSKRVFKVIIIGDANVGKTCLSFRFCNGRFPQQTEATIGVDFRERALAFDKELIRVQLWDTAGQERYRQSIVAHYYRNVNAVVFVYDVTNPQSFHSLPAWISECRKHAVNAGDNTPHILIGNKCDLQGSNRVKTADAQVFADQNNMALFETSALADSEADHVEAIFMTLVHKLRQYKPMHVQTNEERVENEKKLLLKADEANAEDNEGYCC